MSFSRLIHLRQYGKGWVNASDVIGGLAVRAFVGWLYTQAILEK